MAPTDSRTHSFIIKIWIEETVEETGQVRWRGHITHVGSGERRYFKSLNTIIDFVVPYLETMDAKVGIYWHVRRWSQRWARKLNGERRKQ